MQQEYICPSCGKKMKLHDNNTLSCKSFLCRREISLAEYLLSPDINLYLGKTEINGFVTFLINSKDKKFAIEVSRVDNLNKDICNFGPYDMDKLLSVQVVSEDIVVYENKTSALPMLAGGALFGSIGAVAGSMVANKKQNIKKKTSYSLILKIDDIRIPSFYIETEDSDLVYKFMNTIEMLRPQSKND